MPTEDDAGSLSALTRAMNRLADALERLVPPDAAPRFTVGAGAPPAPDDRAAYDRARRAVDEPETVDPPHAHFVREGDLGWDATNGWVELWSGGCCPLADGTKVTVQFRDGVFLYGTIGDTRAYRVPGRGLEYGLREDFWRFDGQSNDIIAYQIDKTPPGERRY